MADKTRSVLLEELSWKDVEEYLARQNLIVVPVGSIEQQGPHLPLGTDSMLIQYIAEKAAAKSGVLVAPTIKLTISHNHIDFPGTIIVQPETLIQVIVDMCRCLSRHGFKKMILANYHGPNSATIDVAIVKLKNDLPDTIIGQAYAGIMPKECEGVLEDNIRGHADEGITSKVLMVAPDLVRMDRAKKEYPVSTSKLFVFDVSQVLSRTTSYGFPRTKSVTKSGIFGAANLGTAEKGRKLLEPEINQLVAEIEKLKAVDLKDYTEGWPKVW